MDDLARWLGEQLDEDKRIARTLLDDKRPDRAERWEFCDDGAIRDTGRNRSLRVKFTWAPEGAHIVRHDPARVLREIDAKRKLLARYEELRAASKEEGLIGDVTEEYQNFLLRLLALPFADRPGYRAEWAPTE